MSNPNKVMFNHLSVIKERFEITVSSSGSIVKQEFELNKNGKFLIGIAITSSHEELAYHRGTQKISLSDQELYPENYETKRLLTGLNVALDDKIACVGHLPVANGKLGITYKDTDHALIPFTAYTVSLYAYLSETEI